MQADMLRDRVTFERLDAEPDVYGNVTQGTWLPFLTVWGGLREERGRERIEAGRLESAVGGVLTVRGSADSRAVTPADRVVIDGVPHTILSISNPDRKGAVLEMTVERGVA